MPYLSDDEFSRYFEYLQLISNDLLTVWEFRTSNKNYIDIKGIPINIGEVYYQRIFRRSYKKFSKQSMDEFLFFLFQDCNKIKTISRTLEIKMNPKLEF